MKQTKPAQAMELRSLSPVFGGPVAGPETRVTEDELVQAIRAVFPPGPRLSPTETIAHAHEECHDVSTTFAERPWPDLGLDTIDSHFQSLSLLSPQAFSEFLPAFMVRGLQRPDEAGIPNDVLEFTTYNLLPDNASPWWLARVEGLTHVQAAIVVEFLAQVARRSGDYFGEPPSDATAYWESRGRRSLSIMELRSLSPVLCRLGASAGLAGSPDPSISNRSISGGDDETRHRHSCRTARSVRTGCERAVYLRSRTS
jgi:hypothetical protein